MINLKKTAGTKAELRSVSDSKRNEFLKILANEINKNKKQILGANKLDVEAAAKSKLNQAFIDRLKLSDKGIGSITDRLSEISKLNAGLDEIIEERKIEQGLTLKKVRVPIGVVLVIYEARPEVTIDVAALCLKSGNAAILKGGSESLHTNNVLFKCVKQGLVKSGLPENCVAFVNQNSREQLYDLLDRDDYIDLVIARGGYGLVNEVKKRTKIPVLAHASGGARYYIDKSADTGIINNIIVNAKTSKPAACNSADAVLIHEKISGEVITSLVANLQANGVKVLLDKKLRTVIKKSESEKVTGQSILNDVYLLSSHDYATEFLSKTIIIKSVASPEEACKFIEKYGKKHSEGIIAADQKIIDYFRRAIDTAAVFVNCSTRLNDGYVFGLGAEMGIATGKQHARGPVGLKELTIYTWEIYGKGQIRE